MIPTPCFIGLGSNLAGQLESPAAQLRQAQMAMQAEPEINVLRVSPFYRSFPLGLAGQPDYCNAVAAIETSLAPLDLLSVLQAIETVQGRLREQEQHWGPRTLDLDILLYGDAVIDVSGLAIPHPEMCRRNFVLWPLADIAPLTEIPGGGTAAELARRLGMQGLSRWDVVQA